MSSTLFMVPFYSLCFVSYLYSRKIREKITAYFVIDMIYCIDCGMFVFVFSPEAPEKKVYAALLLGHVKY